VLKPADDIKKMAQQESNFTRALWDRRWLAIREITCHGWCCI